MERDFFLILISAVLFLTTIAVLARLWKRGAKARQDYAISDLASALVFLFFIIMTLVHAYESNPDASIRFLVDLFILICFSMVFSVLIGNVFLSVCRFRKKTHQAGKARK
jgi:cytochrome bd-type quinol oxidase subunit 2